MTELLRAEQLSVHFGGVKALSDVDLVVRAGTLVGLIGPNGAGKTTFIDAIGGFVPVTGRVLLGGEDITELAPHRRARAGLGRTWQAADLFDELSVRENLRVAAGRPTIGETLYELVRGRGQESGAVEATLADLGIESIADRQADELTQGQRKLVGVARALAARPKLMCLDEPAAGLDTEESRELGQRLRRVVERGTAILLVDHDMGLVLSVCDQVVVLNYGEVIARGVPEQIRRDHAVVEAYLGRAAEEVEAAL
jgi:branched-chain amino acid transport system ATP-binding protein